MLPALDVMKEYLGLLISFPDVVTVHRGAVSKAKDCDKMKEECRIDVSCCFVQDCVSEMAQVQENLRGRPCCCCIDFVVVGMAIVTCTYFVVFVVASVVAVAAVVVTIVVTVAAVVVAIVRCCSCCCLFVCHCCLCTTFLNCYPCVHRSLMQLR